MTRSWMGALLIAATALTPIAAQAGGFGTRVMREAREGNATNDVDRAPRPQQQQQRQQQRSERQQERQERQQQRQVDRQQVDQPQQQADQPQRQDGARWQNRRREGNRDFGSGVVRDAQRAANPANNGNVERRDGRYGGRQWDRNRDGTVDDRWDRNDNGRVDRQWDRNRDGNLDRRWDRNDDNRLDRRYDRNGDGSLDRRYDRDRDGRYDRRDRLDNRTGQRWNHSWRNDRRYDWRGHRSRYSNHYRLGNYYAPYRNYSYRRLSIGFGLSSLFYSDRYWINDPWSYRLPDVYGPYRWVRYYDDALLVDLRTGEVVDTIYSFFW